MHEERRQAARHPFFATAEITEPQSRYSVIARTNELSRRGCYLDMLNPLVGGTALNLRIIHGGEAVDIPARVVHFEPNVGMGLEFDATDSPQRQILDRWLAGLDHRGES